MRPTSRATRALLALAFISSCASPTEDENLSGSTFEQEEAAQWPPAALDATHFTRAFESGIVSTTVSDNGSIHADVLSVETSETLATLEYDASAGRMVVSSPGGYSYEVALTEEPTLEGATLAALMIYKQALEPAAQQWTPQDSPGCDGYPDTVCTTHCCAEHDRCYRQWGCTAASWYSDDHPNAQECDDCNSAVAGCIATHGLVGCHDAWYGSGACTGWTCGCTNHECFDAVTNVTYCASECLPPGQLPPGVTPPTTPPSTTTVTVPTYTYQACSCGDFDGNPATCEMQGDGVTIDSGSSNGQPCDMNRCGQLFYATYVSQCATYSQGPYSSSDAGTSTSDAGSDATYDATPTSDAGTDATYDAPTSDAGTDATYDATPTSDAGTDATYDAPTSDAGTDATYDGGTPPDASYPMVPGPDAGYPTTDAGPG